MRGSVESFNFLCVGCRLACTHHQRGVQQHGGPFSSTRTSWQATRVLPPSPSPSASLAPPAARLAVMLGRSNHHKMPTWQLRSSDALRGSQQSGSASVSIRSSTRPGLRSHPLKWTDVLQGFPARPRCNPLRQPAQAEGLHGVRVPSGAAALCQAWPGTPVFFGWQRLRFPASAVCAFHLAPQRCVGRGRHQSSPI